MASSPSRSARNSVRLSSRVTASPGTRASVADAGRRAGPGNARRFAVGMVWQTPLVSSNADPKSWTGQRIYVRIYVWIRAAHPPEQPGPAGAARSAAPAGAALNEEDADQRDRAGTAGNAEGP